MLRRFNSSILINCLAFTLCLLPIRADEKKEFCQGQSSYVADVKGASDEGIRAIRGFQMPVGMKASLFAAEPLLANPVAFCFDEKGRCFVAETFRLHKGVTDNRVHMNWLDEDIASRTVADRVAMYKRYLKDQFPTYEVDHDRVRLVEDTNGDGVADKSTVFADGFATAADGLGSGVLARKGHVYYTCIPSLYRFGDSKNTGRADQKQVLSTGYGVHVAFLGHDLHGLRFGPDGKLYFSIGDRGLNVVTAEGRHLANPDSGAVLRCDPDGANLELFATGLRNPQKLAFDDFGNLFTGDNNSDSGDKARLVYVVEGGDSGWRMPYQYGTALSDRGPFNAEKIWHLPHEGQPAYVVPPLAHIADGPSGFCYYPGTGLSQRYDGHFFLCDFRGSAGQSGVRSFAVKPKGASFEIVDQHKFIWSILATDCEFGPDGGFFVSDWVNGWELTGKGRIYRFTDPQGRGDAGAVKKMLAEGFDRRTLKELEELLAHQDGRIRQEAQFALADRGDAAVPVFARAAKEGAQRLARIHAIWGLGQIGHKSAKCLESVPALLEDPDPEVRAQAAKVLGDDHSRLGHDKLALLLKDKEPRVRFFAAQSLAKVGQKSDALAVLQMLRADADGDAFLRHAGVMALVGIQNKAAVLQAARDTTPAVRRAALLTLRRWESPEVALFLDDSDPSLVDEAARAIYDLPIPQALPRLAALCGRPKTPPHAEFRALNANFRIGKPENALAIAKVAANPEATQTLRVEALEELGQWAKPAPRDRVTGFSRLLAPRSSEPARESVRAVLAGLFNGPARVRKESARLTALLGIKEVGPDLLKIVEDQQLPGSLRIESLTALHALHDSHLAHAVDSALASQEPALRSEARRILVEISPAKGRASLRKAMENDSVSDLQGALHIMASLNDDETDHLFLSWLDRLLEKKLPAAAILDLLEAAQGRKNPEIQKRLKLFEDARDRNDPLAAYRESLFGGNAEAGRKIFLEKTEVTCQKCHKVDGLGGEVGPDIKGIGARQTREYLLESIVYPNKQIAKGFETVVILTTKGLPISGVLKSEDVKEVRLMTPEGQLIIVPKNQIDERSAGKSAMPEDLIKYLSKRELRDLVEFLASQK